MPRYAAVDIGSNSVRMMVADATVGGEPTVLAADRKITRLGESVFRAGVLSEQAIALVCDVLAGFAEQVRRFDVAASRAVATSAVRDASNQAEFLSRASRALGMPVETISGTEEARLIHLGVRTRWPQPDRRVLIIDVGGGSAEFIVTERGEMANAASRPLGAVRLTQVFLQEDPPAARDLERMEAFIAEKLAPTVKRLRGTPVEMAIGTSASAAAVVCAANQVPRAQREEADREKANLRDIQRLYADLRRRPLAERKRMVGIGPRRAEIIVPGAAVFLKALELLNLPALHYSVAGVRDGIVADLATRGVGREQSRLTADQRRTVEEVAHKYQVTPEHAHKVAEIAAGLFAGTQPLHQLSPSHGRLLEAAAMLSNIGHFVSDTGHHKHSAYLVANSDLPGFTARERELVSLLCRFHRKSMPSARHDAYQALSPEHRQSLLQLIPLLRMAVALDQSQGQRVERVQCEIKGGQVVLALHGAGDTELEQWAAERAGEVFQSVYGKAVAVVRVR